MKIITFEEHIVEKGLTGASREAILNIAPYYANSLGKDLPYFPDFEIYANLGEKRIADMDKNGIDMQVLSCPAELGLLEGNEETMKLAQTVNDKLSEAKKNYPERFLAFAVLPWTAPEMAAKELERAVKELGMNGVLLGGRPDPGAKFLDDPSFDPILSKAEELEVPIYIHPGTPHPLVQDTYYERMEPEITARISLFGWGWHNEAGIQVMRMILNGCFEKHPKLQVISGHWGEFVPYYLFRMDQALPQKCTGLSKTITQTYREHVYVTPSGIFDYPLLRFAIDMLGAERILYSVDFPLVPNEGAREFLENAPISEEEKERIGWKNAVGLLKL